MTQTIVGTKLNKLVKESKSVDAMATILASRHRIRGFTDIERLKKDAASEFEIKMVDKEAEGFFKALENEGYGSIVKSRKLGGRARFLWKYDMRQVCDAVIKGKNTEANELPESMRRIMDASRKPKSNKRTYTKKDTAIPKTLDPEQMTINGQVFMRISPEELLDLKRLKEAVSKLV